LFGGEPILDWDFIQKFVKRIKKLSFDVGLSIITNGTTLDSDKIDFLVDNFNSISFSIDGTYKGNVNRIGGDGESTWNKSISALIETVAKAKNTKTNISVTMVINDKNVDYMVEGYNLMSNKLGLECEISFDNGTKAKPEYLAKVEEGLHRMFVVNKWKPFVTMEYKSLNPGHKKNDSFCFNPKKSITVNAKGQLVFCHAVGPSINDLSIGAEKIYGDLKNGIYNAEYYNKIIERTTFSKWSVNKKCETCEAATWCKGGCIAGHSTSLDNKTLDNLNENQCKINKIIDKISKMILEEYNGLSRIF
jgi:radical SAM protein with 4Fe4S-binding SPASM domain